VIAAHSPRSVIPIHPHPAKLCVVTVITNPVRYLSRYRLYRTFEKEVFDAGAILYTVECAFGTRPFEITDPSNPQHIQVRSSEELWLKENLMNIGIGRLPSDADYVATIDGDLTFARSDWAQETIQQLQHFEVVQMYTSVHYLNAQEEVDKVSPSFMASWINGGKLKTWKGVRSGGVFYSNRSKPGAYPTEFFGAPGGAWAYRRSALNGMGGLQDFHILGSGDTYMVAGLLGVADDMINPNFSADYKNQILRWQAHALSSVRQNVGTVSGSVLHHWHGPLTSRQYNTRQEILCRSQFAPTSDIKKDAQGVIQLHDDASQRFVKMRDDIRSYFRSRDEDATS
jgi:hypothetical protein